MTSPFQIPEVYARLGVQPVINAQSWVTSLGGSRMRPEVLDAMNEAATCFVDMVELNRAAGEVVARICGAEAGMVTAGASAAGTIAVAACMTGVDRAKVEQLPDSAGMKDEVVVFWGERNRYDMSFELPGARIVEWGIPGPGAAYQLDAAITDRTCAVAAVFQPLLKRGLSVNEMCEVAHARGVPVIVDAAAEVPPLANLTRFIDEGADLAFFSGGKGIAGPQNAGLLAGRADLMEAAYINALNLDAPRAGVGRGMKASKESIVGMVVALELLIETGEEALHEGWMAKARYIRDRLSHIPGLRVVIEESSADRHGPQPVVYFEPWWRGPSPAEIRQRLLDGDPPIHVGMGYYADEINLVMVCLRDGEEETVAERLLRILEGGYKPTSEERGNR